MNRTPRSAMDFVVSYVTLLEVGTTINIQSVVEASQGRYTVAAVRAALRKMRENGGPVGGAGTMAAPFVKVAVGSDQAA